MPAAITVKPLTEVVPFAFYTKQLTDDLTWGLGFYVPFGLSSDYQQATGLAAILPMKLRLRY
ncbi:hypothetical protein [Alishewanella longhuensis]